jgi:hypothetical protein
MVGADYPRHGDSFGQNRKSRSTANLIKSGIVTLIQFVQLVLLKRLTPNNTK